MPTRKVPTAPNTDPTILFFTLPPILILGVYLVRKWYLARRLRLHGIGKGTSVRKIRVTPEIAERLAGGENVSPDEIAAASAKADELAEQEKKSGGKKKSSKVKQNGGGGLLAGRGVVEEIQLQPTIFNNSTGLKEEDSGDETQNEWLPEHLTQPKKRSGKGKKK